MFSFINCYIYIFICYVGGIKNEKKHYMILREKVDDGKGDIIYNLFSINVDMLIVTMSARSMLDTLGFGSFLDRIVYDTFRNHIILDCDVVINDTKR